MSDRTVARRYAKALHEEAESQGRVEKIDEDVALIQESLDNARELERFFTSPIVGREKKENVVEALFEERLDGLTYRFLLLLVQKNRESLIREVARAYLTLRDEQRNIVEAHVRTADPLEEGERERLQARLEQMTDHRIRLRVQEDSDLIGGLVVRVKDRVYDGSVQNHLENLRGRMEQHALGGSTNGAAGG